MSEGAKLSVFFGERDRVGGRFLADALAAIFARHRLRSSVVLRGIEGFGAKHLLHTDRLLTLSEDLPLLAIAVDERAQVQAALDDVRALGLGGLVTLERARLLDDLLDARAVLPAPGDEAVRLTVHAGRRERTRSGRPAHLAVVETLHRHGVAGATVLLGVDGTAGGARQRARLVGRNERVPLLVVSVGDAAPLSAALADLAGELERPLATVERVRVLKRDGARLAVAREAPADGWQKLMVFAGEQARHDGAVLHRELLRRLRTEGAAGATSLRGTWGYHGDHRPHGDVVWALRRRVPVVTVVVDRPAPMRRWRAIVDELTEETGLVTDEVVPWAVAAPVGV